MMRQTTGSEIVLSVLDLAGVREGGSIAESFSNTVKLAQAAEKWGYRRFWLAEHHNMPGIASAATSVLIGMWPEAPKPSASVPAASCCPITRRW